MFQTSLKFCTLVYINETPRVSPYAKYLCHQEPWDGGPRSGRHGNHAVHSLQSAGHRRQSRSAAKTEGALGKTGEPAKTRGPSSAQSPRQEMKHAEIREGRKGLMERVRRPRAGVTCCAGPPGYFRSRGRSILAACDGVEILPPVAEVVATAAETGCLSS